MNQAMFGIHKAVFPFELASKVIQYYSFEDDVVLDPFAGVGTTGKAAASLNRRFVMIDLDAENTGKSKTKSYIKAMINRAPEWGVESPDVQIQEWNQQGD
jgi:DNA modification methylase